jgi:hypothetical protein
MRTHSWNLALLCGVVALLGTLRAQQAPSSSLSPSSVWRVTTTKELKGITRVSITVGDLGSSAAKCTWSKDDLLAAASRPLTDASIKVVDGSSTTADAGVATLSIDGSAKFLSDAMCVGYLSLALTDLATPVVPSYAQEASAFFYDGKAAGPYALIQGDPPGAPTRSVRVTLGDVRLLSKGGLLSAAPSAFSQGAQDATGRIVAGFVSEIKLANQ